MKRLPAVLCAVSLAAFAGEPSPQPTSTPTSKEKTGALLRGTSGLGTSVATGGLGTGSLGTRGSSTKPVKSTTKK